MSVLTRDELLQAQQGLELQVQEALASLQFAQGALQCLKQLIEALDKKESEENHASDI
jgi:hypothetical protein